MDNFEQLKRHIENAESIAIITHVNPDGDTLGASLALKFMIEKTFDKSVQVVINSRIPEIYNFLPRIDEAVHNTKIDVNKQHDLVFAVDVASKDRMGYALPLFQNAKIAVNIDHHVTNNNYGAINYNDESACSAGEVIFKMSKHFNWALDKDIATCLYTSICTDTGNFKYENTSAKTFQIVGELVEAGATPFIISRNCYGSKPKAMVMLSAFCINNAVFLENDRVVYALLREADMKKLNADNDATEGIVETLREIKTVDVSILLKEINSEQTKVSLRSKTVDVSEISAKFDGGGHKFAAGCTIKKPITIAAEKILEEVKKRL